MLLRERARVLAELLELGLELRVALVLAHGVGELLEQRQSLAQPADELVVVAPGCPRAPRSRRGPRPGPSGSGPTRRARRRSAPAVRGPSAGPRRAAFFARCPFLAGRRRRPPPAHSFSVVAARGRRGVITAAGDQQGDPDRSSARERRMRVHYPVTGRDHPRACAKPRDRRKLSARRDVEVGRGVEDRVLPGADLGRSPDVCGLSCCHRRRRNWYSISPRRRDRRRGRARPGRRPRRG